MRIKKRAQRSVLQRLAARVEAEGLPPRMTAAYLSSLAAAVCLGAVLNGAGLLPAWSAVRQAATGTWVKTLARLGPPPPRLVLDIKQRDMEKLQAKRDESLARGILLTSSSDLVPARVRFEGKTYKAKLRLKGDWATHLQGRKWSYRIRIRDDGAVMGMPEFSIHHPGQRNFLSEWVFHEALKREDVLTPRYDFVAVTINGKDLGIYAIEEHFGDQLLERSRRRKGPILKFDESLMWEDRADRPSPAVPSRTGLTRPEASATDVFKLQRLARAPKDFEDSRLARGLFEGFRRGKLSASEVFDIERFARFIALSDLFGAGHAGIWHNLRFYFDPVAARFEPIAFDGDPDSLTRLGKLGSGTSWSQERLMKDPGFRRAYVGAIDRFIEAGYLDALVESVTPGIEKRLGILRREFPEVRWDRQDLSGNRDILRSLAHPVRGVHAFLQRAAGRRVRLRVANIQRMPVEVLRLGMGPSDAHPPLQQTVLPAFDEKRHPEFQAVEFLLPKPLFPGKTRWEAEDLQALGLEYRTEFSQKKRVARVVPWPYPEDSLLKGGLLQRKSNPGRFPFLIRRRNPERFLIRPGDWVLTEPLIVPAGAVLAAGPGTRLTLRGAGAILTRSPLRFRGSADAPIEVAAEGTGQGLLVLGTALPSIVEGTRFLNLAPPAQGRWALTGAVTFSEADVLLKDCLFRGARAEDSLNIIRSTFSLDSVVFERSQGDALDVDFGEGRIKASAFMASGNDALDVSGTVLELEGVRVSGAGDKGLSAGELSGVSGKKLDFRGTGIGVASKDGSLVRIVDSSISETGVGAAVYQKKAGFGPGRMSLTGTDIREAKYVFLIEEGSSLAVDGRMLPANAKDLKSRLYLKP